MIRASTRILKTCLPKFRTLSAAVAGMILAGACSAPPAPSVEAKVPDQKIDGICAEQMSFDVAGMYYPKCVDYLRAHSVASVDVASTTSQPAEHKACLEIGLTRDSPEYQSCVQELYQLDLGSAHL
jgi:hypothetical protein